MNMATQRQISLGSVGGSRFEDFESDVHYCGRCQIQFSTMYAFINHRTEHCHFATRGSQEAPLNAVQLCEAVGSSDGHQVDLQPWQQFGIDGDAPASAAFSHPSGSSAQVFATPHLPAAAMDSSAYPAAAGAGDSTCVPAVVVEGAAGGARPASKPSVVSVPVLSAAGTPLELLVQVPQAAAEAEAAGRDGVKRHRDDAEPPPAKPPPKKRLRQRNHVCDICGHRCAYPKDLKRHKFKHMSEKFCCSQCGAVYSRPDKLAEHVRLTHRDPTARRRIACPVEGCSFRSVNNHHVQKHMRDRHSDVRPHSCQMCNYSAKHAHQLTVHLRCHTGDCPYPCQEPDCGRSFRTSSDLKRHQLFHSGDQPFTCALCSFASAFRGNYYKHLRRMHGVDKDGELLEPTAEQEPAGTRRGLGRGRRGRGRARGTYPTNFWCDRCSASFVRKEAYLVHLTTHLSGGTRPAASGTERRDGPAAEPGTEPAAQSAAQPAPQPDGQPTQPAPQSVQPADQPVQAGDEPVQPADQPVPPVARPVPQLATPAVTQPAAQAATQPTQPAVSSAAQPAVHAAAQPVQPADQPVQPADQPVFLQSAKISHPEPV